MNHNPLAPLFALRNGVFQWYRLCICIPSEMKKNGAAGQPKFSFFLVTWEWEFSVGSLLQTTQRCHRS